MSEHIHSTVPGESVNLVRTLNQASADFVIAASQIEYIEDDELEVLKTEDETMSELWQSIQDKYWFMRPEYRNVEPTEQWMISVGRDEIPVFNYSETMVLSQEDMNRVGVTIARFGSKFPSLTPELKAITVRDMPYKDPLEDDMAVTFPDAGMFEMSTYALQSGEYRPDMPIPRLEAVVLHELAHFIMDQALEKAWTDAGFTWDHVIGYSNKLQYKANQPEACVSNYAVRGGVYEDIAESVTAYILGTPTMVMEKRELLAQSESWLRIPESSARKLDFIVPPRLPRQLYYFLDYEEADDESQLE